MAACVPHRPPLSERPPDAPSRAARRQRLLGGRAALRSAPDLARRPSDPLRAPSGSGLQWQRLFFAQVLPLAAALQGLEILHASAVVLDGRALGFVAPSGTGKTSLAINLAAAGAELLTDDVLALDVSTARPTAYEGARLVNVARHEYAALDPAARLRLGSVIGRTAKVPCSPGRSSLERSARGALLPAPRLEPPRRRRDSPRRGRLASRARLRVHHLPLGGAPPARAPRGIGTDRESRPALPRRRAGQPRCRRRVGRGRRACCIGSSDDDAAVDLTSPSRMDPGVSAS